MPSSVRTVHVVFKTHLDIGFTDLASNVRRAYADQFVPGAIRLARELAEGDGPERFVWTTGSWLISDVLANGTPGARADLDRAIREGYVAWHALPFTTHSELMSADLFRAGIAIGRRLDSAYGRITRAAKMTDVPGHTIGIVPLLAEAGIHYLHIGTNPMSATPQVPSTFVWRAPDGSEVVVSYSARYGTRQGQALEVPGLDQALFLSLTGDNHGPPSTESIRQLWKGIAAAYPGADIHASTLEDFGAAVWARRSDLPVVTSEIGDSWIHGVGSDPTLVRRFRVLQRFLPELRVGSLARDRYVEDLLMVPEHTWGMDLKTFLPDYAHYTKAEFAAARSRDRVDPGANAPELSQFVIPEADPSYARYEASWQEKRDYLEQAIGALDASDQITVRARLDDARPVRRVDLGQPLDLTTPSRLGGFGVAFGPDGSISSLVDDDGRRWADPEHRLGAYRYVTYASADYDRWFVEYHEDMDELRRWAVADFGKPGIDLVEPAPEHRVWQPRITGSGQERDADTDWVHLRLALPEQAVTDLGGPAELLLSYGFDRSRPEIEVSLSWFGKDAYRLPEASWLSFAPAVADPSRWRLNKLGTWVNPLDVVPRGGRTMHAVGVGLHYCGDDATVEITSADAPLVAPGLPRLLTFDDVYGDQSAGFAFNLHNNVWGTNFRMWFDEDALFRFRLTLHPHSSAAEKTRESFGISQ